MSNWSVVLFGDALGAAAKLSDSLFDKKLYSVGLGVRYQTLIGPVRLEYGRNVNPRVGDPSGTLTPAIQPNGTVTAAPGVNSSSPVLQQNPANTVLPQSQAAELFGSRPFRHA